MMTFLNIFFYTVYIFLSAFFSFPFFKLLLFLFFIFRSVSRGMWPYYMLYKYVTEKTRFVNSLMWDVMGRSALRNRDLRMKTEGNEF